MTSRGRRATRRPDSSTPSLRDPEGRQRSIHRAALREFSTHGFHGARVERIARAAGVNVRMLYHYYGDKQALFQHVLRSTFEERITHLEAVPPEIATLARRYYEVLSADQEYVRLMEWEALGADPRGDPQVARRRRTRYRTSIDRFRDDQRQGTLPSSLDADLLLLSLIALAVFPLAFPQVTALITEEDPRSPSFADRYGRFVERLAQGLSSDSPPTGAGSPAPLEGM